MDKTAVWPGCAPTMPFLFATNLRMENLMHNTTYSERAPVFVHVIIKIKKFSVVVQQKAIS